MQKLVLLVEDEPMLLQNTTAILEMYGFAVLQATNGLQGLEQAKNNNLDIIICDVMMDEMNGFEMLAAIKAIDTLKNIPFIFLSARADIVDKEKGISQGANAYFTKPFIAKDLVKKVQELLSEV